MRLAARHKTQKKKPMKTQLNTDANINATGALAEHRKKTSGLPLSGTEPTQD